MTNKFIDILIGLFLCIILEKHAIAAILGREAIFASIISIVAFCFLISLYLLNNKFNLSKMVKVNTVLVFILVAMTFLYGFFSTLLNQMYRFDLLIELSVMLLLFFVAKSISIVAFSCFLSFSFIISSILAIILMLDRGYVFSGGINYLLISMPLGLTAILSFSYLYTKNTFLLKITYLLCFFVCFTSLFYLQSRAVFLTTILFVLIIHIYYTFNKRSYFKSLMVSIVVFSTLYLYSDFFAVFYSESSLHNRLDSFLSGSSHEPRNEIYVNYFSNLSSFYFSGFGLGGTELGLFSNMEEKYPHNFILEFWSELGLIGLFFSIYLLIICLIRCFKMILIEKAGLLIVLFFMFFMMNFMKSFSIYQASIFFISIGLLFNDKLFETIKYRDIKFA